MLKDQRGLQVLPKELIPLHRRRDDNQGKVLHPFLLIFYAFVLDDNLKTL
jgi:hypothetical protein